MLPCTPKLSAFDHVRLLVVGDLMLDRFWPFAHDAMEPSLAIKSVQACRLKTSDKE